MTRILILEDDKNQRTLYGQIVEDCGAEPTAVRNGVEGLVEMLIDPNYQGIVCDCSMPRMCGPEFIQALTRAGYEIPILLHSAVCSPKDVPAIVKLIDQYSHMEYSKKHSDHTYLEDFISSLVQ